MKKSRAEVEARQKDILAMVGERGEISVAELAQKLGVSLLTIRRDLQCLEEEALLERFYGGVRRGGNLKTEEAADKAAACCDRIAKYAASLVGDGDSIFINTSSTALRIIPYIKSRNVTVITNNGNAIHVPHQPDLSIILTGGELRYMKGAMVGDYALASLSRVIAKKCFVGCSGLSLESGMTTENANEVNTNEMMLNRVTDRAYILADHRKIGKKSSFVSWPIENVTDVITDTETADQAARQFEQSGIRIYRV